MSRNFGLEKPKSPFDFSSAELDRARVYLHGVLFRDY